VKDLNDGFDMIKASTFSVDRQGTMRERAFLEDIFGDILPVRLQGNPPGRNCLTQRLMRTMSMETFFLGMVDCPDKVHGIMRLLTDNAKRLSRWAEKEGLLALNNGNECTCGTCFNYTTLLPRRPVPFGRVRLKDLWGGMDGQEAVGTAPAQFHEFCFPYYKELAELFGLVYWGCCEPVAPIWETLVSRLPNLKAVSISKWARQEFMAEALAGAGIVELTPPRGPRPARRFRPAAAEAPASLSRGVCAES
jgi:hypothetical protein